MASDKKSANLMRQIDENLRRVYRQEQEDGIPDRFQKLLEQLKSKDQQGEGQDSSDE